MYRRQSQTTKKHFKRSEESFSFAILRADRDRQNTGNHEARRCAAMANDKRNDFS